MVDVPDIDLDAITPVDPHAQARAASAALRGNKYWQLRTSFTGNPPMFEDPFEVCRKAVDYLEWLDENPLCQEKVFGSAKDGVVTHDSPKVRIPTTQGFAVFLGCTPRTLDHWRQNGNRYHDAMAIVDGLFQAVNLELAAADLTNHQIVSRILGLKDGLTVDAPPPAGEGLDTPLKDLDPADVRDRLAAYGLTRVVGAPGVATSNSTATAEDIAEDFIDRTDDELAELGYGDD